MSTVERIAAWFEENLTYENFRDWASERFAAALVESGVIAEAQAEALRDAAEDVQDECHVSSAPCFCGSADWLNARAARIAPEATR